MPAGVRHNVPVLRESLDRLARELPGELPKLGAPILTRIGARAIGTYMVDRKTAEPGERAGDVLGIRTGRLARSLTGAAKSGVRESENEVELQGFVLHIRKGSKVPYAYIHEFGGEILQRVSEAQRGFFWHLFMETGQEMYRAMALSRELRIRIQARPYLGPALTDEETWIADYAERRIGAFMRSILQGVAEASAGGDS